jgi:hypothetical protein
VFDLDCMLCFAGFLVNKEQLGVEVVIHCSLISPPNRYYLGAVDVEHELLLMGGNHLGAVFLRAGMQSEEWSTFGDRM